MYAPFVLHIDGREPLRISDYSFDGYHDVVRFSVNGSPRRVKLLEMQQGSAELTFLKTGDRIMMLAANAALMHIQTSKKTGRLGRGAALFCLQNATPWGRSAWIRADLLFAASVPGEVHTVKNVLGTIAEHVEREHREALEVHARAWFEKKTRELERNRALAAR